MKKFKYVISVAVILFTSSYLLVPAIFAASPDALRNSIDQKAKELEELNKKVQETQSKIEETQGQKKTLTKEVQKLDYTLNQLNLNIKSSEVKIQKTNLEIESLENEISEKETNLNTNRLAITELLRTIYQRDNESALLMLLKNRSLAEGVGELQNISNFNTSLESAIIVAKDLKQKLENNLNIKSEKKNSLETERGTLKNRQSIAGETKKDRGQLLAQTKNQEKLYQQQLSELEKRQQAASDEIEKIEDELRKSFDPGLLPIKRPGVLTMPIATPRITQKFGVVSWLYRGKPHNGVDFGMPIGTEVFAADDGAVIEVEDNGKYQYGKYILIKHDNNLATLYAHLSRQIVKLGQQVKRGELIGYSGNTGYSVGRGHLHLGLYWAPSVLLKTFPNCPCGLVPVGVTLDPLDYL